MNSKIIRIALNIVIVFFVGQARADKHCYKPSTPAELQAAVDETQEAGTFVEGVPNILLLCAGTEVKFKKGDPQITYNVPEGQSYVMRCESYAMSNGAPCVIDGGGEFKEGETYDGLDIYKPADNSDRRLFVGNGGFLDISTTADSLFFEGLVIKNFFVTGYGGAFKFKGYNNVYFNKCIFFNNHAKGARGGAIDIFTDGFIEFKECNFNLNIAANGAGGAISAKTTFMKIESCLFKENVAYYGGAISYYADDFKIFYMTSVAFVQNVAIEGGALFLSQTDGIWFDLDFNGNDAAKFGDALFQVKDANMNCKKINYHKDTVEHWSNPNNIYEFSF